MKRAKFAVCFAILIVCMLMLTIDVWQAKALVNDDVEVVSIETGRGINETWKPYYNFFHEETIYVKLTVRNNLDSAKTATLFVVASDDVNQIFDTYSENSTFQAGETRTFYVPVYVPQWPYPGPNCSIASNLRLLPEETLVQGITVNFFLQPTEPIRDVAVLDVVPSAVEVYAGWKVNITIAVFNKGDVSEDFNVTLKYELKGVVHVVNTTMVSGLTPETNRTLVYTWTTEDVTLHTIIGETSPLPNESDLSNNNRTSTVVVKAKILGDVNNDDVVDVKDVALAGRAFGSYLVHPGWNVQADIDQNDKVDIKDIGLVARNFGKTAL